MVTEYEVGHVHRWEDVQKALLYDIYHIIICCLSFYPVGGCYSFVSKNLKLYYRGNARCNPSVTQDLVPEHPDLYHLLCCMDVERGVGDLSGRKSGV